MEYLRKTNSILSWLKFKIGLNPTVVKENKKKIFIPEPYKSVVIIYADFELAWAWRYSKNLIDKKNEVLKIAERERTNVPKILQLCNEYEIPITWATVGHLFLESCTREKGIAHHEIKRNEYFENDYWKYDKGDWFDDDPCGNYVDNSGWYCPDLIKSILNSNIQHEIGCHTFSHIDCSDAVCSKEVFQSEIYECMKIAGNYGINLNSFVHPGHTIGNLNSLKEYGFTSYRTDYGNILGYPAKHINGLWEIKGTMELTNRKKWDIDKNIVFYKEIIGRAIKNNKVCVFWFHPSFDNVFLQKIMPEIFSYLYNNKNIIKIFTAGKYVNWLNDNHI